MKVSIGILASLAVVAFALSSSASCAHAASKRPGLLEALQFDVGYEVSRIGGTSTPSVYARNNDDGGESSAFMVARYNSLSHGIGLDASFRFKPWFSVGLDGHLQRDFTPLTHPWFETQGIRFGRRDALTLGAFAEFRPLQRTPEPRTGLFVRSGLREVWFDRHLTRERDVVVSTNGRHREARGWVGVGYRVPIASSLSLHIMIDLSAGVDSFEGRLRIGGSYQ